MKYVSTRGEAPTLGFNDTLLAGLASDGGLYVPESWPQVGHGDVRSTFAQRAAEIMAPFVAGEIPETTLASLCRDAYSTFRDPLVAPRP